MSKDIIFGAAVVPYAQRVGGWILPGGQRTASQARATAVAQAINAAIVEWNRGRGVKL